MKFKVLAIFFLFSVWFFGEASGKAGMNPDTVLSWRSSLYPENWKPGYADSVGRFFHDFSYAGYHQGEKTIPNVNINIVNVTQPPYNADNTGQFDVTSIIQQALDSVGKAGGGVVYLPEGTYKVNPGKRDYGLRIAYDSTVLRGAGPGKTFIYNNATYMRFKSLILIQGQDCEWGTTTGFESKIRHDLLHPVGILPMESVDGFQAGDAVIVRTDGTDEFIAEHIMAGIWTSWAARVMFMRTIDSVDRVNNLLYIDSPTRYFMKTRDNARVYHAKHHLAECGVENMSIGNLENPKSGWDEETYQTSGTGAYEVHFSHVIELRNCENSWVKNVHTFKPSQNETDVHVLSNCLILNQCRNITVNSCFFEKPQYEGGGGNGYMYTLQSNDCLIKNSGANHSRHNFDFKMPHSNGNVLFNCLGENSKYSSDFHMYLSMSNLIDNFTVNGDYLESVFRPYGGNVIHGYSSTQSVFYNTYGQKYHEAAWRDYIIESRQFGWGYVIGTSGPASNIRLDPVEGQANGYAFDTSPRDFAEGIGQGEGLVPWSLYLDQFNKRMNRETTDQTFDVGIKLINKETKNEISNAVVKILNRTDTSDIEGLSEIKEVPASFHITVSHKSYLPYNNVHTIVYSDTLLFVYLQEKEYEVTVKVTDESIASPFAGIQVVFAGISKNTDQQGTVIYTLNRGTYNYSVFKQSYKKLNGNVSVESDTLINLYMERTHGDIRFRLKYENTPVEDALIVLNDDSTYTNSIGYTAFNQLTIHQSYPYSVQKDGYKHIEDTLFLMTDTTLNLDLELSVTGKNTPLQNSNITIWPVPVQNKLYVFFSERNPFQVQVLNVHGINILSEKVHSRDYRLDTSSLKSGIYILKVSYEGFEEFLRFIKL